MKTLIPTLPPQSGAYQQSVHQAWKEFIDGVEPQVKIPDYVLDSWIISREASVDPLFLPEVPVLDRHCFKDLCGQFESLLEAADPILGMLDSCICGTGHMAVLTASSGHILATVGDQDILDVARSQYHVPGADRNIERVGASAMNLCLRRFQPVQLCGFEHYNATLHNWRCASAPILADSSGVLAALTISGDIGSRDIQALALVTTFANYIGMRVRQCSIESSGQRLEALLYSAHESLHYPFAVLDGEGRITHANSQASEFFGHGSALIGKNICSFLTGQNAQIMRLNLARASYYQSSFTFMTASGLKDAQCSLSPVDDGVGSFCGMALAIHPQRRQPVDDHAKTTCNATSHACSAAQTHSYAANYVFSDIHGNSPAIKSCVKMAERAAARASRIVIYGESGTGKELLAQSIHNAGPMASGPFIGISCAAIPTELIEAELFGYDEGAFTGARKGGQKGRLELANKGTLFLDEVNSLPLDMQVKLLRVLQEMRFSPLGSRRVVQLDLRVIAASNENLNDAVKSGRFRADLYYRLNVMEIIVPPLRERTGDVELLAVLFWRHLCAGAGIPQMSVATDVMQALKRYPWPGNIRELQNVCERAWVMSDGETIGLDCLPPQISGTGPQFVACPAAGTAPQGKTASSQDNSMESLCKELVKKTLEASGGNLSKTAKALGISRPTLYRKLKKYGLS